MNKILEAFEEIVELSKIAGENPFKVRAYEKALRTMRGMGEITSANDVQGKAGFGTSITADIASILNTGTCDRLETLRKKCPPKSVTEFQKIPGIGPKNAKRLWEQYGVTNLLELKEAIEVGKVKEAGLKEGIEFALSNTERTPIGFVLPRVLPILEEIRELPAVLEAEFAGSLRRRKETVRDVDILVRFDSLQEARQQVRELLKEAVVDADGERKIRARLGNLKIDVLFVPTNEYGAALQYFTGSKDHNVVLRKIAKEKGLLLNEKGLFRGAEKVAGATEESIYDALGVPWLPPELRQDGSEVGKSAPKLIEASDIKGTLHNHTHWSDGGNSLVEMVNAAKKRGHKFIAITDHSKAMAIAHGMSEDVILKQKAHVVALRESNPDINIYWSSEMDVLADGRLDYSDDVVKQFDLILLSLHRQPRSNVAERFIKAIEHIRGMGYEGTVILCHPSGRQFDKGDMADTNWNELFEVCAKYDVVLEINSLPERLDLDYSLCKLAKAKGCKFVINTDSHATNHLDLIPFGVDVARRAWLTADDIINTRG